MIEYIIFFVITISLIITSIYFIIYKSNCKKCKDCEDCPKCEKCKDSPNCPKCKKCKDCPDCPDCPEQDKIKVGDQVYFESLPGDGAKIGCIKNINYENGMAEACTFYHGEPGTVDCDYDSNKISSFHKTNYQKHPIPCDYRYKNCKGIPNICKLKDGDYYPGIDQNTQFKSEEECIKYFGENNTWGKCVKYEDDFPFQPNKYWSLGCNTNEDCGDNRKCLDDGNPLNKMRKICSCKNDNDCNFKGNAPNNSSCGGQPGVIGTTTCPK